MQGVSSLFEMLQRYFEADIILPILIAAAPWLMGTLPKKKKVFLSGILFFLVILFNGITFWIMEIIGESETYYRFFWILPLGCLVAGLVLKIWDQLKNNWQKLVFVLVSGVVFFFYSDMQPEQWKPRNLYYLPEETMAIADMIHEESEGKVLVNVFDYSRATYGVREYNANIVLVDDGVEMTLENIFNRNMGNVTGRLIDAVIVNNQIEYVYIEKEKENAQMVLMSGGAFFVGETAEHKIYRFDLEDIGSVYNKVIYSGSATEVWGMEYATVSGVTETVRFYYEPDGRVQKVDDTLEVIETYFESAKEFEAVEFEGFTLCAIDNGKGTVSEETIEQFVKLIATDKPIILLLSNPIPDGTLELAEITDSNMRKLNELILVEHSPVSAIFARGYEQTYRARLSNGVMQCVCIPTVDGGTVVITIKGESF